MTRRGYSDKQDLIRCSACGFPNDPNQRSSGHEYIAQSNTISGVSEQAYEVDSGGCARCFSPEWNSGAKITWGRRRRY